MSSIQETQATVFNRIKNDKEYACTYPQMKSKGYLPATHELHVFLGEINPSQKRVDKFFKTVEDWNDINSDLADRMNACYRALIFRDENGAEKTVKVMQSARYFRSDKTDEVVRELHDDADFFAKRGFNVLREKIGATAFGIDGIPETDQETKFYRTKYFEFHIKIGRQDVEDISSLDDKEIESLNIITRQFTSKFKKPIPLSYNCSKDGVLDDCTSHERFLNVRFRNQGMNSIQPILKEINLALPLFGLRVIETTSEYVWYDSFTTLDKGWIDYTQEELDKLELDKLR